MTLLSDKDVEGMQAVQELHMPETVYLQRLTMTDDGAGGFTEAWNTYETTKGRLGVPTSREMEIAKEFRAMNNYVITLPADIDLLETDQIQISSKQYRVNAILKRSQKTALRVLVTEL